MTFLSFASLGDIYGYRRIFLTGISIFAGASLACALSDDNNIVRSGITITMITLIFLMSGITALTIFEPGIDFLDLTYEAASAMGTVGLTADLTPILSRGSHVILMILMYVGRIGPLTMALALSGRSDKISKFRELPEENVMLG